MVLNYLSGVGEVGLLLSGARFVLQVCGRQLREDIGILPHQQTRLRVLLFVLAYFGRRLLLFLHGVGDR